MAREHSWNWAYAEEWRENTTLNPFPALERRLREAGERLARRQEEEIVDIFNANIPIEWPPFNADGILSVSPPAAAREESTQNLIVPDGTALLPDRGNTGDIIINTGREEPSIIDGYSYTTTYNEPWAFRRQGEMPNPQEQSTRQIVWSSDTIGIPRSGQLGTDWTTGEQYVFSDGHWIQWSALFVSGPAPEEEENLDSPKIVRIMNQEKKNEKG